MRNSLFTLNGSLRSPDFFSVPAGFFFWPSLGACSQASSNAVSSAVRTDTVTFSRERSQERMKCKRLYPSFSKAIPVIFRSLPVSEILRVSVKSQSCYVEFAHGDNLRSFTRSFII